MPALDVEVESSFGMKILITFKLRPPESIDLGCDSIKFAGAVFAIFVALAVNEFQRVQRDDWTIQERDMSEAFLTRRFSEKAECRLRQNRSRASLMDSGRSGRVMDDRCSRLRARTRLGLSTRRNHRRLIHLNRCRPSAKRPSPHRSGKNRRTLKQ